MKGTYFLIIFLSKNKKIEIGSLGKIFFKRGYYLYVGSAMGKSVNIENRLRRHFQNKKRIHWHIDYFLSDQDTKLIEAYYILSDKKMEEEISNELSKYLEFINGFGASDICSESNLFYAENREKLLDILIKICDKFGYNLIKWEVEIE